MMALNRLSTKSRSKTINISQIIKSVDLKVKTTCRAIWRVHSKLRTKLELPDVSLSRRRMSLGTEYGCSFIDTAIFVLCV